MTKKKDEKKTKKVSKGASRTIEHKARGETESRPVGNPTLAKVTEAPERRAAKELKDEKTMFRSPALAELADTLRLDLPQKLLATLAERGIRTLSDVRKAGGLGHVEGLPVSPDEPAIRTLEAHANLSILSSDVALNAKLIEKGYASITAIADSPRHEFVAATHEQMGDIKAAQIYEMAAAQSKFLNNVLTGIRADMANNYLSVYAGDRAALSEALPPRCTCKDCETAVSPLAYLVDLLGYATKHIKQTGGTTRSLVSRSLRARKDDDDDDNGEPKPKPPKPPSKPMITPHGGGYNGAVSVRLSTSQSEVEIYYTLDGSEPNRSSTKYTGPVILAASTTPITKTLKARAYLMYYDEDGNENWVESLIAQATFTITPLQEVAIPTITPNGGTLYTPASVWLSTTTPDSPDKVVHIRYTLDGSEPTEDKGTIYTGTIKLEEPGSVTVKAKAFKEGMGASPVATASFTIAAAPAKLPGRGLMGEYYDNTNFTDLKVVRTDARINFDWGSRSPDPSIDADTFSVRWTGRIEPRYSEIYTFYAVSDDGIRVWIDGKSIINNWTLQPPTEVSDETIALIAGRKYNITVEFYENGGGAVTMLMWESPSQPKEVVPQSQLFPSIDLQFLADTFHQPFDRLPASCKMADEQVRQARICIEVLRSYLAPLGYWAFNEGKGGVVVDSSGHNLNGTLVGATWTVGRVGSALSFDGLGAYVQLGDIPQLKMTTALSVVTWIRPTTPITPGDVGIIVNKEGEYEVARYPDGTIRWALANTTPGWDWVNTEFIAPLNQWTHLALVYDNQTVKTYANGRLVHAAAATGAIGSTDAEHHDFRIGSRQAAAQFFQGYIDEVKIYSRALTPQEITLSNAEQSYRLAAYTMLLTKIGTSFDEIRLARSGDESAKKALAERLGIDVGYLDALFLNPLATPEVLTEHKLEELFGLRDTTQDPVTDTPSPSSLETWRLEYLRTLWKKQDHPIDPYFEDYFPEEDRLPIIDPDIIGPDDFRYPDLSITTFGIWKWRRDWIDLQIKILVEKKKTRIIDGQSLIVPDLDQMLELMYKTVTYRMYTVTPWASTTPVTDFDQLHQKLTGGTADEVKNAKERINQDLCLMPDSFGRLMAICSKDHMWWSEYRNEEVKDDEWRELFSILVQAQKARLFPGWITEEKMARFHFGPNEFWFSLREPKEGDWPPIHVVRHRLNQPMIDPELGEVNALPNLMIGKTATVLWQHRRARLDKIHKDLKTKREAQDGGFDAMLKLAIGDPNPSDPLPENVDTLYDNLKKNIDVENTKKKIREKLYMTPEAFLWQMDIRGRDADPARKPTETEYEKVYTILTSAAKAKREYANWLDEEKKLPLIDPEAVKLEDLPDGIAANARADSLRKMRKQELDDISQALKKKREDFSGGFDAMLTLALGLWSGGPLPPPNPITIDTLITLYDNLKTGNDLANTKAMITGRLHMTVEDFTRVMAIRAKDSSSTSPKPAASEYAEVYALLTTAQKIRTKYADWAAAEKSPTGLSLDYWQAFKAKLPRWRASTEARQAWQRALRIRSSAPIIDPDVVKPGDIKNPVSGDPAFDRWQERQGKVTGLFNTLKNTSTGATPLQRLNDLFAFDYDGAKTGFTTDTLLDLAQDRKKGIDITGRLNQLSLDNPSFAYLIRIINLATNAQPILEAEWEGVYSILVQVYKKHKYAEWRDKERGAVDPVLLITLSPDFFKFPEVDKTVFPPPPPPWDPTAWRSTWGARRDWQDALQSRIDQKSAVIEALMAAVSVAEETTLPMLRDALVMAINKGGNTLNTKAKWVTDYLLIDAKAGGCQMTTRVSQAMETIQGVLWSIRTGLLEDTYPDLDLVAPNFDEEWEWIGSYATWRAAMLVFMYPENILLPSLRKHQTPAFGKLVSDLRNNRRLTPGQARGAAKEYAEYFRDVCGLKLEACTRAKPSGGTENLLHLFARSTVSNKVYWSYRDPKADPSYAQSFWTVIDGLKEVLNLIGAVVYGREHRFIYLFARTQENREQKLVFVKYDLAEEKDWDEEFTELELPHKATDFTASLKQTSTTEPPQLGIWLPDGTIYTRSLNIKGNGWEKDNFQSNKKKILFSEWSEAPASQLGNPRPRGVFDPFNPFNANDVAKRFTSIDTYAGEKSYYAGFPNFHENSDPDPKYGMILIKPEAAEWRDIPASELGNPKPKRAGERGFNAEEVAKRIQAVNDYAYRQGTPSPYVGAFPNFHHANYGAGTVYGTYLIKRDAAEWRDIPASDLVGNPRPRSVSDPLNPFNAQDIVIRFQAVNDYARARDFEGGFPSFHEVDYGSGFVYGAILIKNSIDVTVTTGPWVPPCQQDPNLAPKGIPFEITEQISENQIQERKQLSSWTYQSNNLPPTPRSNLTYVEEAFYFVPIQIALELQQRGQYIAALDWFRTVYDYSAPVGRDKDDLQYRKIYYGLSKEESLPETSNRAGGWLLDPLNPHLIAETRRNTYTRYTLFSLIRCFLEYADAEFARDTAESVPRARTLYMTALELLDAPELKQGTDECELPISALDRWVRSELQNGAAQWLPSWMEVKKELTSVPYANVLSHAAESAKVMLSETSSPWGERFKNAIEIVRTIVEEEVGPPPTLAELLEKTGITASRAHSALLSKPALAEALAGVGASAAKTACLGISRVSGIDITTVERDMPPMPSLRKPAAFFPGNTSDGQAATNPNAASTEVLFPLAEPMPVAIGYTPTTSFWFCVPANPVLDALKLRAELNLFKLRTCRNIAGMLRQLEPYAAPTDTISGLPTIGGGGQLVLPGTTVLRPTPYRHKVLIERAKQLVSIAQQMEAAMLSALEKRDAEAYQLLKARQDVRLARAGVTLQDLRITEAMGGVTLAQYQEERAQKQTDYYGELLEEPISVLEWASLGALGAAAGLELQAAGFHFLAATAPASISYGFGAGWSVSVSPSGTMSSIAAGLSSIASSLHTTSSILSTLASYERRSREWSFQKTISQQDVKIAKQQIQVAEDHVKVVGQEKVIAEMQTEHAEAVVEFLANKFTNVELYDWMIDILERVYSFFLQQATSMAKLAENQLAFERHETPPAYIQADYWEAQSEGTGGRTDGKSPDRRGLTGSARLLQDIYQLDQYAFETDKRKLQLTKTISLSRLSPAEFQRFCETGVMTFNTPMELFDRDFPGHYLRLIKRVRTSVIALIPATQGIKAQLSNGAVSRVVIGGDVFQTVIVRREPESVALTSARDATGLFELEPQSEMLFPFEALGVDTLWEFSMPKAANLFDYSTIADVLITIEYTALNSYDYRQQVIQSLPSTLSADRPFSFHHQFADQWYDLHNPDQTKTPMVVKFKTRREDFPPNIDNLKIQQVVLYFVRANGNTFEVSVSGFTFTEQSGGGKVGGGAESIDGVISTRRGNAGSWTAMLGKAPFGEWELALPDIPEIRNHFKNEEIEDILFVITYSGRTPEWPK